MKRLFKVTIRHSGAVVAVTTSAAVASWEAVDDAWARYETKHGFVNCFDLTYATEVESPPRARKLPKGSHGSDNSFTG